jgi:hypothetical protein
MHQKLNIQPVALCFIVKKKWLSQLPTARQPTKSIGIPGMKSGNRSILQRKVESTFYDDARQTSILCFSQIKYTTIT